MLVAYWSDDEDKIVTQEVDSLEEEHPNYEGDGDFIDADVLVAFENVSKAELLRLTQWAHMLIEEDLVAFAGSASESEYAIEGVEGVLTHMGARTGRDPEDFRPN